jgi:hypothetical protein
VFYTDDVNILGGSMHTIKENTEAWVVASKEIGLDVNAERNMWSCLEIRMQDKVTTQLHKLLSSSGLPKHLKIKMYRTVILRALLYRFENWSLILRELRRLRGFENRELREIFGSKRD